MGKIIKRTSVEGRTTREEVRRVWFCILSGWLLTNLLSHRRVLVKRRTWVCCPITATRTGSDDPAHANWSSLATHPLANA